MSASRRLLFAAACSFALSSVAACGGNRKPFATTGGALQLSTVVLYRNGVGYFERGGKVEGDKLTLRVRKDQVNDLLKSLTVVERKGGRAVSISMPLDSRTWANAAVATLGPGSGSLFEVLDKLRGTAVTLRTGSGSVTGRILIVEAIQNTPVARGDSEPAEQDYKVTLIYDDKLSVVRLSDVTGVTLHNDDISLQFQRSLDATAGEGMFQQVDVTIRLAGKSSHDLLVSYVVGAPMWKPTYRVVLPPQGGKGKALLQGWAVVDNTTGEDWRDVKLALTSGAPIAFKYDLHTPRDVARTDLSSIGSHRRAQAAVGEAGYAPEPAPATAAPMPPPADEKVALEEGRMGKKESRPAANRPRPAPKPSAPSRVSTRDASGESEDVMGGAAGGDMWGDQPSAVDAEELARSMQARTQSSNVSGLSRYDLGEKLTIPDGTSTMVAIINQEVEGEETFMFKPGGGGSGYEQNPYRVVRFKNSTPFALESGPISIYAGGSFVGEGISEPVSAGVPVTIPFAVESGLMVTSSIASRGDELRLAKIVRGVIEVEAFARRTTLWEVKSQQPRDTETLLYVRHPKAGYSFKLAPRPEGTEDLPDAYLIPIKLAAKAVDAKLEVVEQTPSRSTLSIWDSRALVLFEGILAQGNLDKAIRQKLEPIVKLRQEVARIDTEIEGKTRTRQELDQRAQETRQNLEAIKRDPAAGALRKRLSDRLEQFAKDGDKLGRELVELQTKRTEKKVGLEDAMQALDLQPAQPIAPKK